MCFVNTGRAVIGEHFGKLAAVQSTSTQRPGVSKMGCTPACLESF